MPETAVAPKKVNSHVATALRHLRKREQALLARMESLQGELDDVHAAVTALEPREAE